MRRPVGVMGIVGSCCSTRFSSGPFAAVAMLPSALSRSESFRSVHAGRPQFSRCCHLFGALWFYFSKVEPGPGHRRSHRKSAFGFCLFSSWNDFYFVFVVSFLSTDRNCYSAAIVQWFVHYSTHPQVMQQHCQLSCRGHDGSFLAIPPTALGQL